MPCFKGLAVSIHTPEGPLSEYSVQKQNRFSRISTYIPVPAPRISTEADKAEQSTFAISITLLTPSQDVPYSVPKATKENPNPRPRIVGSLPGHNGERGRYQDSIAPYVPLTTSPNETIAAYIYFDGRVKEEVATLLRKGEETWVNSRWVSVPESEGGGLAEREFLFREVGLESWLNGLDLEGQDNAAIIERRRQKLEKRRRKRKEQEEMKQEPLDDDDDDDDEMERSPNAKKKTLSYGANGELQELSDDDSSDLSDEDDPIPEATGQIKIALYRVLASGTIKKGEYSPQYQADDEVQNADGTKDVDHTTGFAKPKTLDPSTISTQTVTGIDPTDKPYAVFTFFYRGERQLQKMGILPTPQQEKTSTAVKRKSGIQNLPSLGPLKKEGTVGFVGYRDTDTKPSRRKSGPGAPSTPGKKAAKDVDEMDSDSDIDVDDSAPVGKMEDVDDLDPSATSTSTKRDPSLLSAEDAQVSEGIRKMKLKRQHSAEPLNRNGSAEPRKSSRSGSAISPTVSGTNTPTKAETDTTNGASGIPIPGSTSNGTATETQKEEAATQAFEVGSPFKRHRSSMADFDSSVKDRLAAGAGDKVINTSQSISEIMGGNGSKTTANSGTTGSNTTSTTATGSTGLHFGGSLFKPKQEVEDEDL